MKFQNFYESGPMNRLNRLKNISWQNPSLQSWCAQQESNLQPLDSKSNTLSN
jgi:hypothetical protein